MANKIGIQVKDGDLFLNGERYSAGGGNAKNKFNKILVFGTSIETTPATSRSWSKNMADALGLEYGTQVKNKARGGGTITWYGKTITSQQVLSIYPGHFLSAFSCSLEEKEEAADYYVAQGFLTQEQVDAVKGTSEWNLCYDKSLLEEEDVDLYIFGTYGINDRMNYMKWTDNDGNVQTSFTVHRETEFDRRTIYGAYNYVLRELYRKNPNAKVVILGQHTRQWDGAGVDDEGQPITTARTQTGANGSQHSVARAWNIPFADWGNHLPLNESYYLATNRRVTGQTTNRKETVWNQDSVHLTDLGAELLGRWVADWITKTPLTPLTPTFITLV